MHRLDAEPGPGRRATGACAEPRAASEGEGGWLGAQAARLDPTTCPRIQQLGPTPLVFAGGRAGVGPRCGPGCESSCDRFGERWGTARNQKSARSRVGAIGNGSGGSFKCSRIRLMSAGSVIIAIL